MNSPLALVGQLVGRLTGDPVLAESLTILAGTVPPAKLATVVGWRVAMALAEPLARSPRARAWVAQHIAWLHHINRTVDAIARDVAMTELHDDAERHRWCLLFGIDPLVDLPQPLASYRTVNDLFTHAPGPGTRPIASPEDSQVISAPCDGSYAFFESTAGLRSFISKQSHFELSTILGREAAAHTDRFVGGAAAYLWLSLVDNHRWFAPVAGRVVHAARIAATTHGRMGWFLEEGFVEANTRAVIILEDPSGRQVAFIAVGLQPIDTVTITVSPGAQVAKGDPLGTFEIGGSAGVLLFDRSYSIEFPPDAPRFAETDDLINLNYVGAHNRARRLLGQALGRIQ